MRRRRPSRRGSCSAPRARAQSAGELEKPDRGDDRAKIRKRQRSDADLPALPDHAHGVDGDAPRGDAEEREAAEAAEPARAAKDATVVEAVDGGGGVAALEFHPNRPARAAKPVRRLRPRLVDHAHAGGAELVEKEIAAAVAADPRVERMPQQDRESGVEGKRGA